jgi:sigma-E factor negative regulatory protein RseC
MIETQARVLATQDGQAWVEAWSGGGCGLCGGENASGGCGAASIARLFQWRRHGGYRVGNPLDARPGERVMVGVEDGLLLRAALRAYAIPLLALLGGALAGSHWGGGDAYAALGGLLGLGASLLIFRNAARGGPVIVRRLSQVEMCTTSKGESCKN